MIKGYGTTVALKYIFRFYRIHEHGSVSHEEDSFNKHLKN